MANASRRSKQKQQTSKKDLPVEKTDEFSQPQQQKVMLSPEQAELFKRLLAAMTDAQNNLNFALLAANIDGESIVGGHLDGDAPHFITRK